MKLDILFEAAPEDILPDVKDPYAASMRPDVNPTAVEEPPIEAEEPEPELEEPIEPEEEPELEVPGAPGAPGMPGAPDEMGLDLPPPDLGPSPQEWTQAPATDARDEAFSKGGLHLRMRKTQSNSHRWLAQIYNDKNEILDKGFVHVPAGEDPAEYIKDLANQMLSKK